MLDGASSMQLGPEVQHQVESLTIFQRSPHWAAPFEHFRTPVPDSIRMLLREVPLYRAWYRARLAWTFNDRIFRSLHKDPGWEHPERSLNKTNDAHREYFTRYVLEHRVPVDDTEQRFAVANQREDRPIQPASRTGEHQHRSLCIRQRA